VGNTNQHVETVARRKLNVGPDWRVFSWEFVRPDNFLVEGCVPSTDLLGKVKWDGKPSKTVVTRGERDAELARFEAETGKCGWCCGDGLEFKSWDHKTGTEHRPCRNCGGTGERINPEVSHASVEATP